jgi:hypothetical protein
VACSMVNFIFIFTFTFNLIHPLFHTFSWRGVQLRVGIIFTVWRYRLLYLYYVLLFRFGVSGVTVVSFLSCPKHSRFKAAATATTCSAIHFSPRILSSALTVLNPSASNCVRKRKGKGEGKAIPLQDWTGPESSRRLMLPDFKTIGTWRW